MSVNSSTNVTAAVLYDYTPIHIQFVTIGAATILMNIMIIFTLLRNSNLLKKSAFIAGLTFGDLFFGVAMFGIGCIRLYRALNNMPDELVHPTYCMQVFVMSCFILVGNQVPAVLFAIMGFERLLAVKFFEWYYVKWNNKLAWMSILFVYSFCVLSLIVAFIIVNLMPADIRISIACGTPVVVGVSYITYHYVLSIGGGTLAVFATVAAMLSFTLRRMRLEAHGTVSSGMKTYIKRQWNTSVVLLLIAVLDFGAVVLPNILLLISALNLTTIPNLAAIALELACARSIPNALIYIIASEDFRHAFLESFKWFKDSKVTVQPLTQAFQMSHHISHT